MPEISDTPFICIFFCNIFLCVAYSSIRPAHYAYMLA